MQSYVSALEIKAVYNSLFNVEVICLCLEEPDYQYRGQIYLHWSVGLSVNVEVKCICLVELGYQCEGQMHLP